jgi:hypothetical protein
LVSEFGARKIRVLRSRAYSEPGEKLPCTSLF